MERALTRTAPALDGSVWQRTAGNRLVDPVTGEAGDGWVLQTPGCWGDAGCTDRQGTRPFGYIVEDRTGAAQLADSVLEPEWKYLAAAATVDYARQICPQ
ncbi:hypothetical protein [Krasilnikovia sp. M28-CT-15]|uniref:hypothetical protein n=1 Tax=Krasilnikovia sp. M28-CT-15 TaxID=3373540 RepID=UPI0038774C8B